MLGMCTQKLNLGEIWGKSSGAWSSQEVSNAFEAKCESGGLGGYGERPPHPQLS